MIISASGIVIDHYGDVLMIQRDDTRTLAPPGGAAKIGELPAQTVVREVKEETGLIVMPVRLVGLYHLPTKPDNHLTFCYRCIMRGGEIITSEESLHAGFFKVNPFPKPMLDFHIERIQNSLGHQGGPPYWGTQAMPFRLRLGNMLLNRIIYPWLHFRRRRKSLPLYQPPPKWEIPVSTIICDEEKRILWTKSRDRENGFCLAIYLVLMNLPGKRPCAQSKTAKRVTSA
jgi:8-oxo-dGTP diphosphatase